MRDEKSNESRYEELLKTLHERVLNEDEQIELKKMMEEKRKEQKTDIFINNNFCFV
jgi:hypothetical protein